MPKQRIVILGGGSGGLELASQLGRADGIETILVDKSPSHTWKPRLHEMAAGTVATSLAEISYYLLAALRGFRFEQGEVTGIERAARRVRLAAVTSADGRVLAEAREIAYDRCVVALGGATPDFGTPGVAEHAIRLDGKDDADAFRDRFIGHMIEARATGTPTSVVIVGTGATGTELAAHLRYSERGFVETGAGNEAKLLDITLVEAAPVLMPGIDETLRESIVKRLHSLDVKIVTDAEVSEVTNAELRTRKGETWPADLTVWAAGLAGNPVLKALGDFEIDGKGRIVVDRHLRATVDEAVHVLGDSASFTPEGAERPLPPTAQAASQQAAYLARSLPRRLRGETPEPFSHDDKGRLISLGRAGTVGQVIFGRRQDFMIAGQFAAAAYHGLERQHQWRVLGRLRGSVAILADMVSPAKGPAFKLHGG
ncbi:NAD(P)/FAD-dependent oxidoreductase [Aureimonas populi]|uniref:NAD(P)/FAD-dependent oxidoreductase n=1 Tax=Aureimonas populi TaxID=1701758 RepID=A0ABW5CNE4_9HYPH|nr:FAD-dependent oxidoreductase [Aureimonas populi]